MSAAEQFFITLAARMSIAGPPPFLLKTEVESAIGIIFLRADNK
jgi:hypothetical protein